ncbi:MAG TPA: hypothetical protein VFQ39_08885 [Longimicrobium sp.]|nr:hypothetical protein [Longimicrobium sp.]
MRKIRLAVEELAVESFQTDAVGRKGGTVRGYVTQIDTCGSCGSECATCQPFGCPGNTVTCGFASCGRTDGIHVCIGC